MLESPGSLGLTSATGGRPWALVLDEVAAGGDEVIVTLPDGKRVVVIAEERLLALRTGRGEFRPLSSRELEVLRCVAEGATGSAVAQQLGLAANTVAQHLVSVRRKLGTATTAAAIVVARESGLLP